MPRSPGSSPNPPTTNSPQHRGTLRDPASSAKKPRAEPAWVASEPPLPPLGPRYEIGAPCSRSLGAETPPAALEALVWLNWATSEYRRNCSFDDVFFRREGGNQEAPGGLRCPRGPQ